MKNQNFIKQTEFRKRRRALTLDEQGRLLEATEAASRRYWMGGYRAYRLSLQTGLRAGEVKSLRKLSFHDNIVHVESCDTKGKRADDLVIPPSTAQAIRDFLKDKKPTDKAFNFPNLSGASNMIKKDLKDAGIEYTDDAGRDVDFHALRGTFITNLALAGTHPTVTQKMARHTDINLTMKYYTHVLHQSKVDAIAALENLTDSSTNPDLTTDIGRRPRTLKVG